MYKTVISCEHAGNWIPAKYKKLFRSQKELLNSHNGFDAGSIKIYSELIKVFGEFHILNKVSRLLVDANRSLESKDLFSEISKELPEQDKAELVRDYYLPFRNNVEDWIGSRVSEGVKILHFSIHTFTPVLNKKARNADIGLLYDPKRESEKQFCAIWKRELKKTDPDKVVRFNYPYKGTADGFTKYLREAFPDDIYTGIELEVNQKLFESKTAQTKTVKAIVDSIQNTYEKFKN